MIILCPIGVPPIISSTQPHRCPSVLLTGAVGVGKRTIIKAVARRCRMHVIEVTMHDLIWGVFIKYIVSSCEVQLL